jgi:hypothetical protein
MEENAKTDYYPGSPPSLLFWGAFTFSSDPILKKL